LRPSQWRCCSGCSDGSCDSRL
ncbi:photosystem II protein D1 (PsbA), partial [uncultured Synechococcales cyanobacterium]